MNPFPRPHHRFVAVSLTAGLLVLGTSALRLAANTEVDVSNGTTDLTTLGLTSTSDLTFTNIAYSGAATFTNASALSIGTLDDLDATQTITLSNAGGLTLNGGTNSQPGGLPATTDLLYVAGGGTLNLQGAVTLASAATGMNLNVAGTSTLSGAVTSTGGNTFTKTGTGKLTFSAASAANVANYIIAAGTLANGQSSALGGSGSGATFGGTITLGSGSGSADATLTNGNTNLNNNIVVASGGTGTNRIGSTAGGTNNGTIWGNLTVNGALTLGNGTGTSAGGLNFRGATSSSGSGAITIDAGTNTVAFMTANTSLTSAFTIVSGTLSNAQSNALGGSGGGTTFGGTITIGSGSGSTSATLMNSNTNLTNHIVVASGGTGTYKIGSGAGSTNNGTLYGTLTVNNAVTLGNGAGTTAGGLNFNGVISGAGTITIDAGTTNANGNNSVKFNGNNAGAGFTSSVLINSGTLTAGNAGALGASNTVAIASGGTLDAQNNVTIAGLNNNTTSGTVLNNNTTASQARTLTLGGSGAYTFGGNITNGTNAQANTLGLTVALTGSGSQTLSGTNTYTGLTTVSSGKLLINGTNTGGSYSIASGATFGGTGTIDLATTNGSVTIGNGSFLEATSVDTLTFALGTGALNVSGALANASPSMFLTLGAPGSSVISASSTNIGSGVLGFGDFSFTTGSGFGAGTYTLFTSIAGTLGSNLTGTVGGLDAIISQSGSDVILTTSAIPEPATYAALAGALVLAGAAIHRRRQS